MKSAAESSRWPRDRYSGPGAGRWGGIARLAGALALVAAIGAGPATATAVAQETWISVWGSLFADPGTVRDGESNTRWDFGTSFGGGVGLQRRFGTSLLAGVELGYTPMKHELRDETSGGLLDDGRAQVITLMATGRLGAGRAAGFTTYLAGAIGTMVYGIPELDRWDPDFALRGGGGVEYVVAGNAALFLEWNRWWVFHQSEGVDDNTINHSQLQLGLRYGL